MPSRPRTASVRVLMLAAISAAAGVATPGLASPAKPTVPPATRPATGPAATKVDVEAFDVARQKPGVVVLDVRSSEEYAAGHVPGAVNVPVAGKAAGGFDQAASAAVAGKTALVYCHSGVRSAKAVQRLTAAGTAAGIVELPAGWVGWKQAEKPVEVGAGKPTPADK